MQGDELVGQMVTVTNPHLNARWSGVAVAVGHAPSILVEEPGTGRRFMLPLAWAVAEVGCPTCVGPIRETVGMVCQTCGTDYGAKS